MIPVCEPLLGAREIQYVSEALMSGWISSHGPFIDRFEKAFADYIGVRHAITVSSGTAALHLALLASGVRPGDEVIVPTFAMAACANSVCYCSARPVFVDCDPETWTIDPRSVEKKISSATKGIMAVHIYGHPVDFGPLMEIASAKNIFLIEDAAEAIGSRYQGKKCGSLAPVSCFSLYANKMITCGEGGIVCTNDGRTNERVRYLKNQAFPLAKTRTFIHDDIGYNYRLTNIQAAIALAQLENIETMIAKRRAHARRYIRAFSDVNWLVMPVEKSWAYNTYWMFGLLLGKEAPFSRDDCMQQLGTFRPSIDSRPFFHPLHLQKSMRDYGADCSGTFNVAEDIASRGFYLPSGSGLTVDAMDTVCAAVKEIVRC